MLIPTILAVSLCAPPTSQGAMAPNLVTNGDGAWLTWIEPVNKEKKILALKCSRFNDGEWGDVHTIVRGNNFFANWADFPEMGIARDGTLFVTWPQKSGPGSYAYDVAIARSDDTGNTWSMMGTLNDDRVLGEHGFVSLLPEGENAIRAFWLDGRGMTGDGHSGEGGGDMQLRTTTVDNEVHSSELLDDRACECCGTDAAIIDGKAVVAYRDRSAKEIRDISLAAVGFPAKNIHADNWSIEGCPVNGPSMDAMGSSCVVAWYTGAEKKSGVFAAFLSDQRVTPIRLSDGFRGRVDVVMLDEKTAVACWLEPKDQSTSVVIATVHKNGKVTNRQTIAEVASSRKSGFPRIAKVKEGLLIAWTDKDKHKGISTKVVPINQ